MRRTSPDILVEELLDLGPRDDAGALVVQEVGGRALEDADALGWIGEGEKGKRMHETGEGTADDED